MGEGGLAQSHVFFEVGVVTPVAEDCASHEEAGCTKSHILCTAPIATTFN